MIVKGQCIVGSKKLNVRAKNQIEFSKYYENKKPMIFRGNNKDEYIREEQRNRERIPINNENLKEMVTPEQYQKLMANKKKMLFSEIQYMDEDGNQIKDHIVYTDMMVFFKLLPKDMFGGRVLVTKTQSEEENEYLKKEAQREYDH